MKKYYLKFAITSLMVVTSVTKASAQVGYEGDWDRTRLYGHAGINTSTDFSNSDYNWIRDHFEYFTIEKNHANRVYNNGDPVGQEIAAKAVAQKIKNKNSKCIPLMIFSSNTPYFSLNESTAAAGSNNFVYDTRKQEDYRWKVERYATRNLWAGIVDNVVSSSTLEGVFVDGVTGNALDGRLGNTENMMDKITQGFVLYNGFDVNGSTQILSGLSTLEHADGVFVEDFFRNRLNTTGEAAYVLDQMLLIPTDKMAVCNSSVYDGIWGNDHKFSLAAYLMIMKDKTYYRWTGDSEAWGVPEMREWHSDFGQKMGQPLGDFEKNGNAYKRVFKNCTVNLNVSNKTSSIDWNQNNNVTGIYQAEAWEISSASIKSDNNASLGNYVDGNGGFNVKFEVAQTGNVTLRFRIKSPSGTRSMGVYANGKKIGTVTTSLGYWNHKNVTTNLSGVSNIELRDSQGTAELDVDYLQVQISNSSKLAEIKSQPSAKFYPNPTLGVLNLANLAGANIAVMDIYGNVLLTSEIESESESLDLSNLPTGVYILQAVLKDQEEIITQKIIKE